MWRLIAERKIEEAMSEGAFDRLEGEGRPLPDESNPYEDAAQRMAHRLMKNAGITPDWIAEGKEIDREERRIATASAAERRRAIVELNRRIEAFNLKTPVRTAQKRLLVP